MFTAKHIDHVAISVSDLEASATWYAETLGLTRRHEQWDEPLMMGAGETMVALFEAGDGSDDATPRIKMLHVCFVVAPADWEAGRARLDEAGIEYRFADHDGTHSLYLRDPDGHQIEVTKYV